MNTTKVAQHLQNAVNWQRFVNLCASIGDQLNDAQWRFFKAIVFENSMEAYSDGSIEYVGQEGCDLLVKIDGKQYRIEMKYTEHALYTAKGMKPRAESQSITLMNSKGSNTHKTLPAGYADYLLVVGSRAAAVIDKKSLTKFIEINGDSISAKIPTDKMKFVFTPNSVTNRSITKLNLREELNEAVRRALGKIE